MSGIATAALPWAAAFSRAAAFAALAPLAGSGAVPRAVRAALALALTPAVEAHLRFAPHRSGAIDGAMMLDNAVTGAAFGLAAATVAAAAAAAGAVVDGVLASRVVASEAVFGGAGGPLSRLYALAFASAFFGSGAMTSMCERFVRASSQAAFAPTAHASIELVRECFESALALAAPAIAAQFLGTIVAGAAARAAPRINGLMLSSPLVAAVLLASLIAAAGPTMAGLAALGRAAALAPPL